MSNLPIKIVGSVVARHERGSTALEYGIMVAFIAAVVITTVAVLGGDLSGLILRAASNI
jgi:Flp pilus assembly pilin Flp